MTGQRETTRYATPALTRCNDYWTVWAGSHAVGWIRSAGPVGYESMAPGGRYAGLWPTKQAAAEVLVKQAGYELELT